MKKPNLLAISGSLRSASYSTAILETIRDRVIETADIRLLGLHDVPLYNEDEDTTQPPEGVRTLRAGIEASDGVIIASPEYNHGMPGILKNALDWASRPYGRSPLTGKPVLVITSSPASTGGVRAHAQLNETLASIAGRVVLRPQIVIGTVHDMVRDRRLQHDETLTFLLGGIDDLLREIARSPRPREED